MISSLSACQMYSHEIILRNAGPDAVELVGMYGMCSVNFPAQRSSCVAIGSSHSLMNQECELHKWLGMMISLSSEVSRAGGLFI